MEYTERYSVERIPDSNKYGIIDIVSGKYVKASNNKYIRMSKSRCEQYIFKYLRNKNPAIINGSINNPLSTETFVGLTIEDAKKFIGRNKFDGCKCPCCGRIVKAYKKKLHRGIGGALSILYYATGEAWKFVHVDDLTKLSKSYTTPTNLAAAKYWGLTTPKSINLSNNISDEEGRDSGYWCLTDLGVNFVQNKVTIRKHKYVLLDSVVKSGGDEVLFTDIMFENFSLAENNRVKEEIYYKMVRDTAKEFIL
jgi:hypothetical protein